MDGAAGVLLLDLLDGHPMGPAHTLFDGTFSSFQWNNWKL
jgi:hypothetical protein